MCVLCEFFHYVQSRSKIKPAGLYRFFLSLFYSGGYPSGFVGKRAPDEESVLSLHRLALNVIFSPGISALSFRYSHN